MRTVNVPSIENKQDLFAFYIVKVPAMADVALLAAALGEAIDNADALERERGAQDYY